MSVRATVLTVTSTPQELTSGSTGDTTQGRSLWIGNTSADIYLGGDNSVSAANGCPVATGVGPSFDLAQGEKLWAVCATSSTVKILETGV
jgi:hypothetical protein